MKKIITFEKKIDFPSMIGEVSSISLDNDLKFIDESNIEGNLRIYGTYKLTEASVLEEKFDYAMPVDIILNERLDLDTSKISIDDFSYEIENDEVMICNINVKIEGIEKIDEIIDNAVEEVRECDGDAMDNKVIEEPVKEEPSSEEVEVEVEEEVSTDSVDDQEIIDKTSIFSSFDSNDETYTSYSVYILREDETVQSLMDKYKVTKEELEAYNDLSNLTSGSKIIIPTSND